MKKSITSGETKPAKGSNGPKSTPISAVSPDGVSSFMVRCAFSGLYKGTNTLISVLI
jgi:hypothetical protein